MYGIKSFPMKKNSFVLIATLALFLARTSAAEFEKSSETIALPTYVVQAERVSSAEQRVLRSLNTLRDLARAPIAVSLELPALKAPANFDAKVLTGTRLAKF